MQNKLTKILEKAAAGHYGADSADIGKIVGILIAAKFDHGAGPFICGISGEVGPDGLADAYHICPCYGVDAGIVERYERKR